MSDPTQTPEQLFDNALSLMKDAYRAHVDELAKDMAEEYASGDHGTGEKAREALIDGMHETIDSDRWVFVTSMAQAVVLVSGNSGAYVDNFGKDGVVADGEINWPALAFAALEADVLEVMHAMDDFDPNDPCPADGDVEEDEEDDGPPLFTGTIVKIDGMGGSVIMLTIKRAGEDQVDFVRAEGRLTVQALADQFGNVDDAIGQLVTYSVDDLGVLLTIVATNEVD